MQVGDKVRVANLYVGEGVNNDGYEELVGKVGLIIDGEPMDSDIFIVQIDGWPKAFLESELECI